MTDLDIIDAEVIEDMTVEAELTPRQQYVKEMRGILDLLEADPTLPLPYYSGGSRWDALTWYAKSVTDAAKLQRAIGGRWDKNDPNASDYDADTLRLRRVLDREVHVEINVSREKVCTKTVIGTERKKVQKLVQEAVYEDVYETVDKVELKCGSLLSAADQEALEQL